MRLLFLLLIFLLSIAWMSFARFFYVCEIKDLCNQTEIYQRPKTLSLKLRDSILLNNYEQFVFQKKSIQADLSENNSALLDTLSNYLQINEGWQVQIMGFHRQSEKNIQLDSFENVGAARAAGIRNLLINRGVEGDKIWVDFNSIKGEELFEPITFTILESEENLDI